MQNFKEILSGIDVQPLLDQLDQHPELWDIGNPWKENKSRTVLKDVTDIVLRSIRGPDYEKPAFSMLSEARKIIDDIIRAIPGEKLGQVVISRLCPGQTIAPHIDLMPPGVPVYWSRYQIPLDVLPGVVFYCGDEELFMEPGNCYYFDNQVVHSVVNHSTKDRISMRADIRPA